MDYVFNVNLPMNSHSQIILWHKRWIYKSVNSNVICNDCFTERNSLHRNYKKDDILRLIFVFLTESCLIRMNKDRSDLIKPLNRQNIYGVYSPGEVKLQLRKIKPQSLDSRLNQRMYKADLRVWLPIGAWWLVNRYQQKNLHNQMHVPCNTLKRYN